MAKADKKKAKLAALAARRVDASNSQLMRYYPVAKNWSRKIKPHLNDPRVQTALVRDFNRFTFGRWGKPFLAGMRPTDFESCDWRCERRGRQPEYFNFVKHAACHWTANFLLRLAELSDKNRMENCLVSKTLDSVVRRCLIRLPVPSP
jgi:hypothetical protein